MNSGNGTALKILQTIGIMAICGVVGWNARMTYLLSSDVEVCKMRMGISAQDITDLRQSIIGRALYQRDFEYIAQSMKDTTARLTRIEDKLEQHVLGERKTP